MIFIQQSGLISLQIKSSRKTDVLTAIRGYATNIIAAIPLDKIGWVNRVSIVTVSFQFEI